jgi:hypothetical protein|tara:strand:+ start:152 stop:376 length:225 start_codon:yes stop_codon:yes gene_type:complete
MKLVLCSDKETYIFEQMDGYVLMTYWHDDHFEIEKEEMARMWATITIANIMGGQSAGEFSVNMHSTSTPAQWGV